MERILEKEFHWNHLHAMSLSNAFVEASRLIGLSTINLRFEDGNHLQVVVSGNQSNDLDPHIVASLKDMIDGNNGVRDIVVETRSNKLQRISELHPHYLPLQYPLLFPYGEDDYRDDISLRESSLADNRKRRKDGLRVDMYKGIEDKIFKEDTEGKSIGQRIIISGSFTAGPRYMFNNFVDALQIYNWIEFRTLFIGNPRWPEIQRTFALLNFRKRDLPHAHILLWLHNDDNAKTPEKIDRIICAEIPEEEIDRNMYQLVEKYMIHGPYGQENLKSLCMKDRVCTKRFTKPFVQQTKLDANGYTVYRRWEDGRTVMKKKTTLDNEFVVPYNRVLLSKYRAHVNIELCNQKKKSNKYLFKYINKSHDRVMAAFYETRNTDCGAEIRGEIKMYYDCRYLPACEAMWRLFNFDIHYRDPYSYATEKKKSNKYLFKYINKSHDRVMAAFYETRNTDCGAEIRGEIKMYYDCRYLPACEAMWRLFNFDIHYRDPYVIRLSFHLPDHQPLVFNKNQSLQSVLDKPSSKQTMLLAWFEANKNYPHARDLRITEIFHSSLCIKRILALGRQEKKDFLLVGL
ncbi:PREDICTED: uncharacterized protein LOC105970533 [Erythranthe guttata]|uniref:uncharacterized protein LOC105970533 n=1 Tax=Erythranthe guttata TaxID=4155 RepID=UPI00064D8190|nr:PREDICTED: uncharacterized protein LOC105970533 [Erythranthe guttata]|eukprot:XP_012850822.1 PREDICTED: uncharacterized protein LOC105970533 [Erythranthe guttata]